MILATASDPAKAALVAAEVADLAAQANEAHDVLSAATKNALQNAIIAGDCLREAKSKLAHGQFGGFISSQCKFSERTAQLYMQLAEHRTEIDGKSAEPALLTISGALKQIAKSSDSNRKGSSQSPISANSPAAAAAAERFFARNGEASAAAFDFEQVKRDWPTDVSFLPQDLDASHAFRCVINREQPGGAVHPGFLFVHAVEFVSPEPDWCAEQWWTRRPLRWTDDQFGREIIGHNIPPHLRDEAKQAGWRKFNGWDYRSMLARLGAGHVNEIVDGAA